VEQGGYSLVIMDIKMPVMNGLSALSRIRDLTDPPETIMITAHSNMENTIEAMKLGAFDYIVKPFDIDDIIGLVKRALAKYDSRMKDKILSLPDSAGRIIGNTSVMRELYKILGRIASTNTSVLITGETGTGKDLFARAIHYHSSRRDRPFVTVNCASIPAELLESELFGHIKGAFTGATDRREGKCELADGGTLFLDEIGTMRLDLQAKLLRFLQHSEFEPVGSSVSQSVDVRVIAATNADLGKMVEKSHFREDLYYRLMVVPIHIPALRERKEDIPELVKYFIGRYNARYGLSYALKDDQMNFLVSRDWPGNVRELENYLHRMVVLQADNIAPAESIQSGFPERYEERDIMPIVKELIGKGVPNLLDAARERIEKPLITEVILQVRNNQSKAAEMLGVSRNTLRKMLAKYHLE